MFTLFVYRDPAYGWEPEFSSEDRDEVVYERDCLRFDYDRKDLCIVKHREDQDPMDVAQGIEP